MARRFGSFGLIAIALLGLAACTETDDVVRDIGGIGILLTDSGLSQQTLDDDPGIQAARWTVDKAELTLGGEIFDLLGNDSCTFQDTFQFFSSAVGKCASGILIDASDEPLPGQLSLTVTMEVHRLQPVDLLPQGDFDLDGVPNGTDNCPVEVNPNQEDQDMDGIGDACTLTDPLTGMAIPDSDADGVPDSLDNCIHLDNPLQEDTMFPVNWNPPDGVGDACMASEVATVEISGSTDLQLDLGPVDITQARGGASTLTVDFSSGNSLMCDLAFTVCQIEVAQVVLTWVP